MPATPPAAEEILTFWFERTAAKQWWTHSPAFDREIVGRYAELHAAAVRCELDGWRVSPDGRLAEIIVLDQFSRHIHRGHPGAFASDPMALALAQTAVAAGADRELDVVRRPFLYMPYMHSESDRIHAQAAVLFAAPGLEASMKSELKHKAIIDRYGRYPHRNAVLGRTSTSQELVFLQGPGASF